MIVKTIIKVGSRGSKLAQVQVAEVLSSLKAKEIDVDFEPVTYATKGDRDKTTPLTENPADDFFTDALDDAVLNHDVDIAVHSAKDLPQSMREGLSIFALTASIDNTDAFVGKTSFAGLPTGAKVGTSSALRQKAVKALRPDVQLVDIRGTIEERIALVDQGMCDGIVVATAALKRLGLEQRVQNIMPWVATPLQGQLAVVGRSGDEPLKRIFAPIDVRRKQGWLLFVGTDPQNYESFGHILHLPMIEILPVKFPPFAARALVNSLLDYSQILFTSKFAVNCFFKMLDEWAYDLKNLKGKKFLVIGKDTAKALWDKDFEPSLVAPVETSEGLLEAIQAKIDVKGQKILFPRSSLPNPFLKEELEKRGARVDELSVYQNAKPAKRDLPKGPIDKILFTSPSTVKNFLDDYARIPANWKVYSKGPVTAQSLKEAGYESEVLPQ